MLEYINIHRKRVARGKKTEREELGFYQRGFIGAGEYRAGQISFNIDRWRKEKGLKLENGEGAGVLIW
jgi:hypothetical protein